MIGICSKCSNVAELHDGLCCICKMEKEMDDSKRRKNAEAAVKDAFRRIAGAKDVGIVVKEAEG